MAKKMVDDILRTEREGELIVEKSKIRASQIIDDAKQKAITNSKKITKDAMEKAESIIEQAKTKTQTEKQEALSEAEKINQELKIKTKANTKKAIDAVIAILGE